MTEREALAALTICAERVMTAHSLGLRVASVEWSELYRRIQDAQAVLAAPKATAGRAGT